MNPESNADEFATENHYRLDVHLDGNGVCPHQIFKSTNCRQLLEAVDRIDRRPDTIWMLWKEFPHISFARHIASVNPSLHKSMDDILNLVLERDAEIGEPIPAPKNPPITWV